MIYMSHVARTSARWLLIDSTKYLVGSLNLPLAQYHSSKMKLQHHCVQVPFRRDGLVTKNKESKIEKFHEQPGAILS